TLSETPLAIPIPFHLQLLLDSSFYSMETEAPSKKKKGSKRQDVESSRLSNKRKKVYTSFGPQPQTRGNPTPPAPQTE
ncbi:hypothetical protein U1Q18_027411, partial [Sarracenia purpurea var. burkii]